jgi:hypothetical protein
MIYIRLAGGLGNQLFQLAAGAALSAKLGIDSVPLAHGLSKYQSARRPDSLNLLAGSPWLQPKKAASRSLVFLSTAARGGRWLPVLGINDKTFWPRLLGDSDNRVPLLIDGYFQHGWTLEIFQRTIQFFHVVDPCAESAGKLQEDECLIHIRGGDFLNFSHLQVANEDFYLKALQLAISSGWRKFAIVTDDAAYATRLQEQFTCSQHSASFRLLPPSANALIDFDIIRNAPARIIGNSTFAWWASALSKRYAPTWVPTHHSVGHLRDFFLPCEIPISIQV